MANTDSTCRTHDDEVTPLDAALIAWRLHNDLALKVMGLVEMLSCVQKRGIDPLINELDIPKLRRTVGLVKSTTGMHDCLTFLYPEFPTREELDGPEDDEGEQEER